MSAPRRSSATILSAPVSRCAAAQEIAEALRTLQQIAARLDAQKESFAPEGNRAE